MALILIQDHLLQTFPPYRPEMGRRDQRNDHIGWGDVLLGTIILGAILSDNDNDNKCYPNPPPVVINQSPIYVPEPVQPPVIIRPPQNVVVIGRVAAPPERPARIYGSIYLDISSVKRITIMTPNTYPVGLNDQIWFFNRFNQLVGKFLVMSQYGQTLTLEKIWGFEPQNNDGFGIVYSNNY